jgi:glycosyltransferase involved in cell wall biosynthesis
MANPPLPERPVRILTVIHTHWSRNAGGPRVQYELSEEWAKLGVGCEKFSAEDAFPGRPGPWDKLPPFFADRAAAFVRENADRFDVIDAHQTDLPCPKSALGFSGLLVARSVGLIPLYHEALRRLDRKDLLSVWGPRLVAGAVLGLPRAVSGRERRRRRTADVEPSLRAADLINVCNRDEERYVADVFRMGGKCVRFPFGLSDNARERFAAADRSPGERLRAREVVFVGNWESRKGSRDWWKIVRGVQRLVPDASFRWLGTTVDRGHILRRLGVADEPRLSVVPRYDNADLPHLLGGATVGAFPSYIEGFPFAVLEKQAAGLPVVAYDAPGAREMLGPDRLVPPGDTAEMAGKLAALLTSSAAEYATAAAAARAAVEHLRWPAIARDTLAIYEARLAALRADRR